MFCSVSRFLFLQQAFKLWCNWECFFVWIKLQWTNFYKTDSVLNSSLVETSSRVFIARISHPLELFYLNHFRFSFLHHLELILGSASLSSSRASEIYCKKISRFSSTFFFCKIDDVTTLLKRGKDVLTNF